MSILSRLSLEVKEISVKMRRFGTRLLQKPVGRFGTSPTPELGQTPYIQHRHFRRRSCRCAIRWGNYIFPPALTERRIRQVKCRGGCNLTAPAFFFGEFWDTHALRTLGRFGTTPRPRPTKRHKFNTVISAQELRFIRIHASGVGFWVNSPGLLDSENTRHKPQTRRSPTCKATSS